MLSYRMYLYHLQNLDAKRFLKSVDSIPSSGHKTATIFLGNQASSMHEATSEAMRV